MVLPSEGSSRRPDPSGSVVHNFSGGGPSERAGARKQVPHPDAVGDAVEHEDVVRRQIGGEARIGMRPDRAGDGLRGELLRPVEDRVAMAEAVDAAREEDPHASAVLYRVSRPVKPTWVPRARVVERLRTVASTAQIS